MRWTGKLLGGVFGYMTLGTLGALLGVYIGHRFDIGMAQNPFDPERQQRIKKIFFKSTFAIMGHIAKADGQVSEEEIQMAQRVMAQMELSADMKKEAIAQFNRGKEAGFDLDAELGEFKQACQRQKNLIRMFIEVQLQAAFADGELDEAEALLAKQEDTEYRNWVSQALEKGAGKTHKWTTQTDKAPLLPESIQEVLHRPYRPDPQGRLL